jgi:hypothetical protein
MISAVAFGRRCGKKYIVISNNETRRYIHVDFAVKRGP